MKQYFTIHNNLLNVRDSIFLSLQLQCFIALIMFRYIFYIIYIYTFFFYFTGTVLFALCLFANVKHETY